MTAEDEGALLPVFRIGRIAGFDLDAPVLVGARQKVCSVLGGDRDRAADTAVTVKGAAEGKLTEMNCFSDNRNILQMCTPVI